MFERFDYYARRVVVFAQEETRMLNHNYVGTEHLLLALIHEGEGLASQALDTLGIGLEAARQQVTELVGESQEPSPENISFSSLGKNVLELSMRESQQLDHDHVGTEHILLALIHDDESVACQVLTRLGADLDNVRTQVIQLLNGEQAETDPASPAPMDAVSQASDGMPSFEPAINFGRYTDRARQVVTLAQEEARMLNHYYIGTEHILLGLLHEGQGVAARALQAVGISLDFARRRTEVVIDHGNLWPLDPVLLARRSRRALEQAKNEARHLSHDYVDTEHILLGLIQQGEGTACQMLVHLGTDLDRVREEVIRLLPGPSLAANGAAGQRGVVGRNLTHLARAGGLDRVVGRQREIGQVMQILMLEAAVPLLVGEHGAGVTTVARGVAQAMVQPGVPRWFAGKEIIELNLDQLVAAATGPQDLDDRVSGLIGQIRDQPATIWLIERSLSPAYTSATRTVPAIALLRPVLATGELLAIATTTPAEYHQHLGTGAAFRGDFTEIPVNPLTEDLAIEVLKSTRNRQQARYPVSIDDDVIATAVALSVQHLPGAPLPGTAIDLLDRAAAHASHRITTTNNLSSSVAAVAQQDLTAVLAASPAAAISGPGE